MKPSEIRQLFLEFFRKKDHKIVPGTPVIPHGDPTLLFTNAGMNQFKDVFLGTGKRDYKRAANTQKCIRVSGKHNDLEVVGCDGYHHTFFEMLGNWSFGDYFKVEAIRWAWEFLVEYCHLPKERLYATVFEGDSKNGIPPDEEAETIWKKETEILPGHVMRFGLKDNFWEMGATGPCGPCSEIHIDLGPWGCDNPSHPSDGSMCKVNGECARYMEVWNLVFIQFNLMSDGTLQKLPDRHVDTGMGLERLSEIIRIREKLLSGEPFDYSNYNTELFTPIFNVLHEVTGLSYSPKMEKKKLVAFRAIADHIRAVSIAIADGVMPDKKSRGSVIRSLLRRSARFGRQSLGIEKPFLFQLVDPVAEIYKDIFPEVFQRIRHIKYVVEAEEKSFARTIERGITRFISLVEKTKETNPNSKILGGFEAYRLYHQDGFPKDLIEQMAKEEGFIIDPEEWKKAEEAHKKASESDAMSFKFDLEELKGLPPTKFLGYWEKGEAFNNGMETKANLLKIIGNEALILDKTTFYPESGGQVGDTGVIEGENFKFKVTDTGKIGEIIVHYGEFEEVDFQNLPKNVNVKVNEEHRWNTAANHTCTHLLHWALRTVLGEHATQQGSLVSPTHLRFDFTHPSQVTTEELKTIETMVNRRIFENHAVIITEHLLEEAKQMGATALFGEKYGERVRVIKIGDFSMELCGGTHLMATGQAGFFKILQETSVQSGVRRIIAVTRGRAVEEVQKESIMLKNIAKMLSSSPESLQDKIQVLLKQVKDVKKLSPEKGDYLLKNIAENLRLKAEEFAGIRLIFVDTIFEMDKEELGHLADILSEPSQPPYAGLITGSVNETTNVILFASGDIVRKFGINCGEVLKESALKYGKRAGGKPHFAQTGWRESEKINREDFIKTVRETFISKLKIKG